MTTRQRMFSQEEAGKLFEVKVSAIEGHNMVGAAIELPLRDGHVDEYVILGVRRLGEHSTYSTWIGCIDEQGGAFLVSGHYDIPTLVEAVRDIEGRQ